MSVFQSLIFYGGSQLLVKVPGETLFRLSVQILVVVLKWSNCDPPLRLNLTMFQLFVHGAFWVFLQERCEGRTFLPTAGTKRI